VSLVLDLPTRRSTIRLASALVGALRAGDLVILSGELGAGKTFFVRAMLRARGLPTTERVTSPTFALVHEYELGGRVLHADLYRLEGDADLSQLGLRDARAHGAIVVVEWGAPYAEALGGDAVEVSLGVGAAGEGRTATLETSGARAAQILEATRQALAHARNRRRGGG
jgi:tRNA threonylcarbamoyladenosine biosynthesis protein TsaE